MATRRAGDKNAFWDNAAALAGTVSNAVELPRAGGDFAFWVTTSGATTISLEVAHSGDITAEGILPDANAANWAQLYYIDSPVQVVFSAAASACLLIPDFEPAYVRLRTSNAVTLTAGWETMAA